MHLATSHLAHQHGNNHMGHLGTNIKDSVHVLKTVHIDSSHVTSNKLNVMNGIQTNAKVSGQHAILGDQHHTTIDFNPTYVDPNKGIICGHGSLQSHPFSSGPLSHVTTNVNVDGCIVTNGGGIITTGPNGLGNPTVTVGLGVDF